MGVKDTDRDLSKLDENFRKKVEVFLELVSKDIFITEWYRSQERQDYLYSLWRTVPGSKVTWVAKSKHTEGLAIDIAFNGDILYPSDAWVWRKIAKVAGYYGIDWGYDLWETDKPHFQCDGSKYEDKINDLRKPVTNKFSHLNGVEDVYDDFELFNQYEDTDMINVWEVKKLISIAIKRYDDKLKGRV